MFTASRRHGVDGAFMTETVGMARSGMAKSCAAQAGTTSCR